MDDVSTKKNGQTNKIHLSIRFGGALSTAVEPKTSSTIIAKVEGKRESKNRPVATNFQFLKILAPLGQLLVGACLPQTLLERVRQTGI